MAKAQQTGEQVFYYKTHALFSTPNGGLSKLTKVLFLFLCLLICLTLFIAFWLATAEKHPDFAERTVVIVQFFAHNKKLQLWLILYLAKILGLAWLLGQVFRVQAGQRLKLTDNWLHYESGIPWLGRWLDWQLDLETIRKGDQPLYWLRAGGLFQPESGYFLGWKPSGFVMTRQGFAPFKWGLKEEFAPAQAKSVYRLAPIRWNTKHNRKILQQNLQTTPLLHALQARGINTPLLKGVETVNQSDEP